MFDKLIDSYTDRATKNMDRKQREDARKELKSHIMDSAEALAAKQNKPVDEAIIKEVIAQMGLPEEFAASYAPVKRSILSDKVVIGSIAIIVVVFLLVGALWIIGEVGHNIGQTFITEHRQDSTSHAAAGNVSIDLDDMNGNINVVESESDNIEVVYDVRAGQGHLDEVVTNTTYVQVGDTLKIVSEARKKDTGIGSHVHIGFYTEPGADVTVKVPVGSRYKLDLATTTGDVTLTALNGSSMAVNSDTGSIDINGGRYDSITASTSMGSIDAKYDTKSAEFKSGTGNIDLESDGLSDSLNARTSMGHIKAKYNASSATFDSGTGDIELESAGAAESLTAKTSMGHIVARYNANKATFNSGTGDIELDSDMPADSLYARTSMGHIKAKYNASSATFDSGTGDIELDSPGAAESLTASTSMGHVIIRLPSGAPFFVDASISLGRFKHDTIPLIMTSSDSSHMIGYTEGGKDAMKMKLKSGGGDIEISY